MKIGVLTFHKCINYGSYWQARCLVEGLRQSGAEAELLDHDCQCVRRAELRCALQPELPRRTRRRDLRAYSSKVRKFAGAIAQLPMSGRFSLHEPGQCGAYDAIVVGSDEVWNFRHPWYGSKPIFFGDGLETRRLVSYAASFGNHSACDGIDPAWSRKLGRFSAISVRDENSRHLIRGGIDREPTIALDPCLQFPDAARVDSDPAAEPFALVYGHGFPGWLRRLVRAWARRSGTRLVSVGYANDWVDEQRIAAGPIEFARLMAGARAVITNFFHGCVFALLNDKPWVTAPSAYRSIKIPDLAAMLGVEHRLIGERTTTERAADLLSTPGLGEAARRLGELRERSHAYLDAALA